MTSSQASQNTEGDREGGAEHQAAIASQPYPRRGRSVRALVKGTQMIRRAEATSEPDTFFSIPARASIGGRKVRGFLTGGTPSGSEISTDDDPAIWVFLPYKSH